MSWGTTERITFPGSMGENLAARLDLPPGKPKAYALFAHCFTCSKDIFAAKRIAAELVENGIAVLRFDFTGLGHSDGEFANTNFSSNVSDLVAAANWLSEARQPATILIGHSLGGAAVLAAAVDLPDVKAVCTIGAPSDPDHVKHNFSAHIEQIEATGSAQVELAGRSFTISKQFLDDISYQALEEKISRMQKALLVFHAPLDATVSIDNASRIYQAAKHPKSFISLDKADHLLSRREDTEYVANMISAWLKNYIGSEDIKHNRSLSSEGEVVVKETGEGSFSQIISIGNTHIMRADEPLSIGGDDTGPGPYDLLLAGLGACTSMTLRMYSDRKGWPLDNVSVNLSHKKIHSRDCESCETSNSKLDVIDRTLTLSGDLSAEQRDKLLEIADKCPVHRTLHSPVRINTVLMEEK